MMRKGAGFKIIRRNGRRSSNLYENTWVRGMGKGRVEARVYLLLRKIAI